MNKGAVVTVIAWLVFMGVWYVAWQIAEHMGSFTDPYTDGVDERDTYTYGGVEDGEDLPGFENEGA